MTAPLAGILLAAGQGSRFGADKLLHPLADGTPMAIAAARNLARLLAHEGLQVVANPRAREGMGTSIARGVAASADAGGWVIALGDMPGIPAAVFRAVAAGLEQGGDIVAPRYRGRRGHPVGFSARHGPALQRLEGDAGGRAVIAAHGDTLRLIETDAAGVVTDIDTQASAPWQEIE